MNMATWPAKKEHRSPFSVRFPVFSAQLRSEEVPEEVTASHSVWLNFSLIGIKWNLCARLWMSPQFACNIINLQTFKKDGQVNCWNKRTQRKRPITRNESMIREFKMQTFIYLLKVAKTITLAFKCVGKCFLSRGFKGTAFSYSFTFSLI